MGGSAVYIWKKWRGSRSDVSSKAERIGASHLSKALNAQIHANDIPAKPTPQPVSTKSDGGMEEGASDEDKIS